MNKISKKIVALATMAAFVLTLVPAAAFAAPADAEGSYYQIVCGNTEVTPSDIVETEFIINDNTATDAADGDLEDVKVWATDKDGNILSGVTFYTDEDATQQVQPVKQNQTNLNVYNVGTVSNHDKLYVKFTAPGEYYLHAGSGWMSNVNYDATKLAQLRGGDANVVTVSVDFTIDRFDLYRNGNQIPFNNDNLGELNLIKDAFKANGSDTCTVGGYALEKDGSPAVNEEITLTTGNDKVLWFVGDASDGVVKTDNEGYFEFQFKMNDNRNIPITISGDDVTYTLRVIKEESQAYDIDTVLDDGYVLAGTDQDNWGDVINEDGTYTFSDAVQFTITDKAGDPVTGDDAVANEPATKVSNDAVGNEHARYLDVTAQPTGSKLNEWDLVLVADGDNYTLKYIGDNEQKDLIPGKYTVTVSLLSGDYAEASFNVAKFGKVQDTVLDMWAVDRSAQNRTVDITDEVTLGQNVYVSAKYVDENGLKINATDVNYGFDGKAVVDRDTNNGNGFATKDDIAANESLLGTTIKVTAFSKGNHQLVQEVLTVVDSYNSYSLEFDPVEGPVNKDNKVSVSVVDEDGDVAQVRGTMEAYVADKSNEDAVVTVETSDVSKGKGTLTVYASQPTEVDIVVVVDDATNEGLYAGTLSYTAGDGSIFAHHEVVMTIGSSQYVVDKQLFTMDAAPYVDSNWRTMVPIRALAEAFDATVTYDNDDRTVTIEYNEQTIVMTVDESAYTINGEEAEMDTEAVIKGDRTYVPVRFAAEAMGFTVTALYDENSSTASVVFQS